MVLLHDIEVKIAIKTNDGESAGDALKEYPPPKPDAAGNEWSIERYIEAKAGQEVQVEVYFGQSFEFHGAGGIKINLTIDGGTVNFWTFYSKAIALEKLSQEQPLIVDHVLHSDGNEHAHVSFSFGSLGADETIDIDSLIALEQADKIGRIDVKIHWARRVKLKRPRAMDLTGWYTPLPSTTYAKDVVKDKHIRHAMIPGSSTPATPSKRETHTFPQYTKYGCQSAYFVFRYRDDLGLKQLGCIPKDQTPNPNHASTVLDRGNQEKLKSDIVGADNRDRDEIAMLRTQVEQLQGRDKENSKLKQKFEQMSQGFTMIKQMSEQFTTMFESCTNGAPSPSALPNLATTAESTNGVIPSTMINPRAKTEDTLKRIKEEEEAAKAGQPPAANRRPAKKRQKIVIELGSD